MRLPWGSHRATAFWMISFFLLSLYSGRGRVRGVFKRQKTPHPASPRVQGEEFNRMRLPCGKSSARKQRGMG